MRRYQRAPLLNGGLRYGKSTTVHEIRKGISNNTIPYREIVLTESQRLDILAGIEYEDSTLWWIIAAASNIGWGMQVPAGIVIRIPDINKVTELF